MAMKQIGIPFLNSHAAMRKTYASVLYHGSVNKKQFKDNPKALVKIISESLGHKKISTTIEHYIHEFQSNKHMVNFQNLIDKSDFFKSINFDTSS